MKRPAIPDLPILPFRVIETQISGVRALTASGQTAAALLMAWSVFEATARAALGAKFAQPMAALSVVEMLVFEGYLSQEDGHRARLVARQRNQLAHGDLSVQISKVDLTDFTNCIQDVLRLAETPEVATT